MNAPQGQALSIVDEYATSRHMERRALEAVLFKTIMPADASMEDLVAFIQLAHRFDLDPFAREIYCIKSKGRIYPYISVDGYARVINRQEQYDGVEFAYDQDDNGRIVACTCSMFRKDRNRPTVVTEFLDECIMPESTAWRKSPGRMLRHRAFVQAARLTFGISAALDEGSDVGGPAVDLSPPSEPAARAEAPRPRRQPPSPSRAAFPQGSGKEQPASETKVEDVSDTNIEGLMEDTFDINGLIDAMESAKTVEELKTVYNDYEVDDNLQGKPELLDRAQDAFVRISKRLAG